jgi:hypothetical protein
VVLVEAPILILVAVILAVVPGPVLVLLMAPLMVLAVVLVLEEHLMMTEQYAPAYPL